MHIETSRVDDVMLMGVKDEAMQLTELRVMCQFDNAELLTARFTGYREEPRCPEVTFAKMYPLTWSAEQIRMDLFAWVATKRLRPRTKRR